MFDCPYDGTWEFTHKPVWGDKAGQPGSGTLVLRKMDQASGRAEHARLFRNSMSAAANRCKGPSDVFYSGEITFASPPGGAGAEPFSNAKVLACGDFQLYGWFGPATDPTRAHFEVSGSDKNVEGKMEGVQLPWSWVTWKKR